LSFFLRWVFRLSLAAGGHCAIPARVQVGITVRLVSASRTRKRPFCDHARPGDRFNSLSSSRWQDGNNARGPVQTLSILLDDPFFTANIGAIGRADQGR